MILRPIGVAGVSGPEPLPVWSTIEPRQLGHSEEYWLVSQPDHAAVAGQLAAAIGAKWMPELSGDAIKAIAVHDEGWAASDRAALRQRSRPHSFIEVPPAEFVRAWTGSIEHAARVAPLAGIMVSRHFCRLLRGRAESPSETQPDQALMQGFLQSESERQQRLSVGLREAEIEALVDVLQLCDVLSLYLCCGATEEIEFPQSFGGRKIRLRCTGADAFVLNPSPFPFPVSISVPAQHWPNGDRLSLFADLA